MITKALGVALPSGDDLVTKARAMQVIPRVGQSMAQSFFQRELEDAHRAGKWLPKLLLLPDVGKFEIKLNNYKPDLLANGLLAREQSTVVIYTNRNRKMNRYLIYCYWRLYNSLGTPNFWNISVNLIRNSSCLLAVAIHSVDKNMYRELSMPDLLRLMKRINLMRANFHFKETLWSEAQDPLKAMRHYVRFYRVYIPKTLNSVRPLGVPTRAWRIYQKMWLIPIMAFTGHIIPPSFHGYIPQRGTGTAWVEILRKLIHMQHIFEVDFKGFFPSVPTAELTYALYVEGSLPLSVCVYLHYMNNSLPMFLTEDKLPEVHYGEGPEQSLLLDQLKLKLSKPVNAERELPGISTVGLRSPAVNLVQPSYVQSDNRPYGYKAPYGVVQGLKPAELPNTLKTGKALRAELASKMPRQDVPMDLLPNQFDLNFEMMKWKGSKGIPLNRPLTEAERQSMWNALGSQLKSASSKYARFLLGTNISFSDGLPQGATLSPYLSILYLEFILKRLGIPKDVEYLFYADDGLFFSDNYEALSKWVRTMSGHSALPTSLSHYNIVVHKEKSGWVKLHGSWLKPLKFLGLRFVPGATLALSRLEAATRAKLDKAGSTLQFSKSYLVFYEYSMSLLKLGPDLLNLKADAVKTPALKAYYKALSSLAGVPLGIIHYLYLISTVLSAGITNTLIFFFSKAPVLKDFGVLKGILPLIEIRKARESDALNFVEAGPLLDGEKENIFKAVAWLRGGYSGSFYHSSASKALVHKLENGLNSVGGINLPLVMPKDSLEGSLLSFMVAPMFFNKWATELKDIFFIPRQMSSGIIKTVPLDLYRFLVSLLMPVFGVFVPPMLGYFPTEEDRTGRTDHYVLRRNWAVIRGFIAEHQFANLAKSKYFGLIMSRMYNGSWIPEDVQQSFAFSFKPHSLAEYLQVQDPFGQLNVFVGSSYASHEIVRLLSYLKRTPRTKAPFRLFIEGFMPEDSWDVSAFAELETPSLAREFPGGKEPVWH